MAQIVEQLAGGILEILSRADEKFTGYHRKRRGEMRLTPASMAEIEKSIAARAESRARMQAGPPSDKRG
jgi:hypothetical protein